MNHNNNSNNNNMAQLNEPSTPYNLENNDDNANATTNNNHDYDSSQMQSESPPPPPPGASKLQSFLILVAGLALIVTFVLGFTLGWHTAVVILAMCFWGVVLYHLMFTSEVISPFWIYNQVAKAKLKVIQEPRMYTQDDMALEGGIGGGIENMGAPTTRDWTSASGAYIELDGGIGREIQLVFASPVTRPAGRFWSKPKSLMWTISGYGSDFVVKEGLISETGKSYWVEKHDFAENGSRILRLVQGTWDYQTHEFVGDYIDSDGSMGSYPTLAKQQK
ncbi:unnamed protein product [Cylindrotheca closterium]|uniref:Uncharacterized protein n=1 Tax=Cylindrotheca closterium TaxID=2856 RepID=A0AAD2CFQ6_9STRA|nr:unnamed protein product [Cylindrotheca closterium]